MTRERKSSNGLSWFEWRSPDGRLNIELTGEGFLTDPQTEKFRAEFPEESSFEILVRENCNVYSPPESSVLDLFSDNPKSEEEDLAERLFLVFRKGVISQELCEGARLGLKGAARASKNRGVAGGKVDPAKIGRDASTLVPVGDGTRARYITKDGILSDTVEANVTMGGIAGFFPATARNPYVRATAYTRDNWKLFQESWPFLQKMAEIFERENPLRFSNQMGFVQKNKLDERGWVIPGTPYSTVTVNRNFQTACHQDAGDLKSGFENFSVLEGGTQPYKGCYTVFPKFRVAFDCRQGDFVGMDVAHHYHGNTPLLPVIEGEEDFERISLVLYVREDLAGAGTQEEEEAKYQKWRSTWRPPQEQHEYRKGVHEQEAAKDEEFMQEFGESKPQK
jgi:hypothetical protein